MTKTEFKQLLQEPWPIKTFVEVPVGAMFRLVDSKYNDVMFQKTATDSIVNCERYWVGSITNRLYHEEDCCQPNDLCVIIKGGDIS